jgi:hypothetical protein
MGTLGDYGLPILRNRLRGVVFRRLFDFLRRHPPGDVKHPLADIVPSFARSEGFELGFDVNGRLALEPRVSGLVVEGAVARPARRDMIVSPIINANQRAKPLSATGTAAGGWIAVANR